MNMKLSVVIITYNEEKNIERCLNSVKEVADEIIVLDSFSTDKTEEICLKQGVKFFQHKFEGFSYQKNRASGLAENDYILSLDADEVLSEELIESILKVKENTLFDGYLFNRLNIYCGKPIKFTTWYPDRKLRLWNRKKGAWSKNIHETVIHDNTARIKRIKGDLIHHSYNTIGEHVIQTNRFTDIAAEALFNAGISSSVFKIFLKTLFAFFREFILNFAFLGGFYGFVIGCINVFSVFLKYSKLLRMKKES